MYLNIADLKISINENKNFVHNLKWLDNFQSENKSTDINVKFCFNNYVGQLDEKVYTEDRLTWWTNKSGYFITLNNKSSDVILSTLVFSMDGNTIDFYYSNEITKTYFKILFEIGFRNIILFHVGFVLHAAAIEFNGKGILFSAPSGIGKSTQAALWIKYKNARILNADRPAIRIINNEVRVYGTPWSGTANQHLNISAPLKAIFMLEQSTINEVIEISSMEALQKIATRCFLPYFDEKLMELALTNIGAVLQKTPVYLLKCRPDSEAVDVVASCLGL